MDHEEFDQWRKRQNLQKKGYNNPENLNFRYNGFWHWIQGNTNLDQFEAKKSTKYGAEYKFFDDPQSALDWIKK